MLLRRMFSVALMMLVMANLMAQKVKPGLNSVKAKSATVCYALKENSFTTVAPPARYLQWRKNPGARVKTATINVNYIGFSDQAKTAFQKAVDIWETLIYSPVPINVEAHWEVLGTNVLGSASPYTYYVNFDGAQKDGVWYPVALAEKIAGKGLNDSSEPDIYASFNSGQSAWYYGTGSITGKYDLTSVVLHEIGHGLGITHSYTVSNGTAQIPDYFYGLPVVFESFIQNGITGTAKNLVESFASPSSDLATQITGGSLYFNSPLVKTVSANLANLYAPATFSAGSSIAHTDESTYPPGDANSLMTPFFNAAEVNHNPGPLVMKLLEDMGWNNVHIKHTPLKNTENVSQDYQVICNVDSDTTYDASSVKLTYAINSLNPTTVSMTTTGNPNEFSVSIPKPVNGSVVTTYQYFMSLNDVVSRTFSSPGKLWQQGSATHTDVVFSFEAGPDTKPPHITHTPISFMRATDTQLPITAVLKDNIGIQNAVVQFQINGTPQSDIPMVNTADSTYTATLNVAMVDGDLLEYRIKVTDSSIEQNVAYAPTLSTFYPVNVVGLAPTQDSYANNFNSATSDFFGDNLFSVTTPPGFADGSINTSHPYSASDPKDSISYVYQLRVPIRLKASGSATLKYDEIALVEPGDAGSTWPPYQNGTYNNFYDYVIVEASKDGGTTWRRVTKGYDCRDQSAWSTKWSSNVDGNGNSLAVGDPSLYKTRTVDILSTGYFKEGDEVVIRFRLMSDQLAYGWGWSIDNLKIQIDETPPTILHNQVDFVYYKSPSFDLTVKATDASGVKNLSIDYAVNNGSTSNLPFTLQANVDQYTRTLNIANANLNEGDEIEYRINATDSAGNNVSLPSSGFLKIAVLNFKNGVTSYVSDFNTSNTDFVGNFFAVTTPTGFASAGINTVHPYANGFGLDNTTSYSYLLRKPIVVSNSNSKIFFREILIAEYSTSSAKDYAVVEGSKDKGATWHELLSPYSANAQVVWQNAYNAAQNGSQSMFKYREIDITSSGDFVAGDSVVVRFRLFANATNNAWGWTIDDLSIQGTITAVEEIQNRISVYPNPVSSEYVNVALPNGTKTSSLEMINSLGQPIITNQLDPNLAQQQVYIGNLHGGVYFMKINVDQQVVTKKLIVSR